MTIADVIENAVNERLYGLPCTTCKISEHFISLYPACNKVSSWVEPVCTEDTLTVTLTCTNSIAPVSEPSCSPTITIL
jgi:hypothetical protein